jgi:6-phosphogluconate dehydrogenase
MMNSSESSLRGATAKIGLIGLGVMGQNLALNIERNGFPIAVYDREAPVLDAFVTRESGKRILGAHSPEEFVRSLERPRKIILLVKAGAPVDWTINLVKPFLDQGDIIIDGGNSHFKETERRQEELKESGLFMIGSGTSGGEKGALLGPSLMPGGDRNAYEQIRQIWEAIAAKVPDGPCVTYIGPGGSGHFVKMVHNGIEYGDMQLIAEAYGLFRDGFGLSTDEMADIFDEWNRGDLESYLIEITAKILRVRDPETGKPLVDLVLDKAGQKGTGKWTSQLALDLGVPIPTIDAAIVARILSSQKEARLAASKLIIGRTTGKYDRISEIMTNYIHDAL